MTIIPLIDVPRQSLTYVVLGVRVWLRVYWHPSSSSWVMDCDTNNIPAVRGRRIAIGVNLTEHVRDRGFVGGIYCVSARENDDEPGLNAWAGTHHLVHRLS